MSAWYRADEVFIDDGSEVYVGVEIAVVEWRVVKTTPQGAWLDCPSSPYLKRRWVSGSSRTFARTKSEAIDKLICRRKHQIRILERQLKVAQDALDAAKDLKGSPQ